MAELKSKRIVVASELIDHDLARLPVHGRDYHAPYGQALLTHAYGVTSRAAQGG